MEVNRSTGCQWIGVRVDDIARQTTTDYNLTFPTPNDLSDFLAGLESRARHVFRHQEPADGPPSRSVGITGQQRAPGQGPCEIEVGDFHEPAPAHTEAVRRAERAVDALGEHPAVAYYADCGWLYGPTLDVAVRLLTAAANEETIHDGHVSWCLRPEQITPERVAAGRRAVEECLAALEAAGEPYALLAHVDGDPTVQLHYGGRSREDALDDLASYLAEELVEFVKL